MYIEEYLAELAQAQTSMSSSKLMNLSDLSPQELLLFKNYWAITPVASRRQIIERLVELAEDNIELNFDVIFRHCLKDDDEMVRLKAVEGLFECEEYWLIDVLVRLMKEDTSQSVRALSATALGKYAMLAEFEELPSAVVEKIEESLSSVIDNEDEESEVRRRAFEAISCLSQPWIRELIEEAYRSYDLKWRASALFAMGKNCDPRWLHILLKELGNADPEMRFEAARACGEIGDPKTVPRLIHLTHDTDGDVCISAIRALGQIGGNEAQYRVQQCLNDPRRQVREAAEEALEEIAFLTDPLSSEEREM